MKNPSWEKVSILNTAYVAVKRRSSVAFVITVLFCGLAAITSCMTGTATLSGRDGLNQTAPDLVFSITKTSTSNTPKLLFEPRGMQHITAVALRVRTQDNPTFNETFHLISLSSFEQHLGSDVPEPTVAGDVDSFTLKNTGDMVHLLVRRGDLSSARFDDFDQPRSPHNSWLIRVSDRDRFIPWRVNAGGPTPCFPLGDADCFDMQSLCGIILSAAITTTQDAVPSSFTASAHTLSFVPNSLNKRLEADGRHLRGFTLIYSTKLSNAVDTVTIRIPISLYFERDSVHAYRIFIDPLSDEVVSRGRVVEWDNPQRIRVEAEGLLSTSLAGTLFVGTLHDQIKEGFLEARLPALIEDIATEDLLAAAVHGVIGLDSVPNDFDIAVIPEGSATRGKTGVTTVMQSPVAGAQLIDVTPVKLFFLEH